MTGDPYHTPYHTPSPHFPVYQTFQLVTDGKTPSVDAIGVCVGALDSLTHYERRAVLDFLNSWVVASKKGSDT